MWRNCAAACVDARNLLNNLFVGHAFELVGDFQLFPQHALDLHTQLNGLELVPQLDPGPEHT